MDLGIIITGQLRTFFTEIVFNTFINWLIILRQYYKLYIVCVVNEDIINYSKFTFLRNLCERYSIIKFDKSLVHIPSIQRILEEYKRKNLYDELLHEAKDPKVLLQSFLQQLKQIEVGVKRMKEFGNIPTYIKTRFDIFYGKLIIPYSNPNPLFPHSENQFSSVKEFYEFGRQQDLKTLKIPEEFWQINFGGTYYYNNNIFDTNDKLWLSNDYIIIGKSELFEKFVKEDLLSDPERLIDLANKNGINHMLSQESLLNLYIYSSGTTPIMLLNSYSIYVVRPKN